MVEDAVSNCVTLITVIINKCIKHDNYNKNLKKTSKFVQIVSNYHIATYTFSLYNYLHVGVKWEFCEYSYY